MYLKGYFILKKLKNRLDKLGLSNYIDIRYQKGDCQC